jgi:hypothetical protein
MDLNELLPAIVNILMVFSIVALFLVILFIDKIRLNGKEKGGRNIVITLGISLVATLAFSIFTDFIAYESASAGLSYEAMPPGAQVFAWLTIVASIPALIVLPKILVFAFRRKQRHV